MDVALASCARLPEPDFDEAPLREALFNVGLTCRVLAWDDPASDWSHARLTLLRSTWNYARQARRFLDWVESTSRRTDLWNPLAIVRWNVHKRYLLELERAGIPIAPTELIPHGTARSLNQLQRERDWERLVVKPAVSAASYRTIRVDRSALAEGEAHLRTLVENGDALVQEYLPSVETYGERSLVWIDGELTHAVRKNPRFEGEDERVSEVSVEPTRDERTLARRVVAALAERVGFQPMYARVDLAPGASGEPLLMEFELIEPSLFFPQSSRALELFVRAIQRRLGEA